MLCDVMKLPAKTTDSVQPPHAKNLGNIQYVVDTNLLGNIYILHFWKKKSKNVKVNLHLSKDQHRRLMLVDTVKGSFVNDFTQI